MPASSAAGRHVGNPDGVIPFASKGAAWRHVRRSFPPGPRQDHPVGGDERERAGRGGRAGGSLVRGSCSVRRFLLPYERQVDNRIERLAASTR